VAATQPVPGYLDRRHTGFGWGGRLFRCCQPSPCRSCDLSELVFAWPEFDAARPRFQRAGSKLWAGKVHRDQAASPSGFSRLPHMPSHGVPCLRIVVCTVDACDVHAAFHQLADEYGVGCRDGRQCDHDAGHPIDRVGSQQFFRSATEQVRALVDARIGCAERMKTFAEHGVDGRPHGEQRGLDVRLAATQRRESIRGEAGLQIAQIMLSNCPVMQHVPCTLPVHGGYAGEPAGPGSFGRVQLLQQFVHVVEQVIQRSAAGVNVGLRTRHRAPISSKSAQCALTSTPG